MFFKNALILLLSILLNIDQTILFSLPFYSSKNFSNLTTPLQIIDSLKNNKKYFFIEIGKPSQKLPLIYSSHDSSLTIMKKDCPIKSNYDLNLLKNAKITYEENNKLFFYLNDYISLNNEYRNIFMTFIHYNLSLDNLQNTCLYLGTQFIESDKKNNNTINLFLQLKNYNLIDKNIFYYNYTADNNNGFLNIGKEPFEINPKLYSNENISELEVNYLLDYEKKNENTGKFRWNLNISKIFYFKKIPLESNIDPYIEISRKNTRRVNFWQALLVPEEDLIKGPFEYQEQIEKDFFNPLNKDNICKKITFEGKYFYVCKKQYKYVIQKTFPSLYFYHKELNYMFELKFDDLFFEKNEFLIFSIYFDFFQIEIFRGSYLSEWFFGKTFLKKYCFSFDLDNGKIRFYPEKKIKKKTKKNNIKKNLDSVNNKKRYYQLGLILVVLAIGIFAFVLDRVNKRKYRINNSLIDYENR